MTQLDSKTMCKLFLEELINREKTTRNLNEPVILRRLDVSDDDNVTSFDDLMMCDKIALLTTLDSNTFGDLILSIYQSIWTYNYEEYISVDYVLDLIAKHDLDIIKEMRKEYQNTGIVKQHLEHIMKMAMDDTKLSYDQKINIIKKKYKNIDYFEQNISYITDIIACDLGNGEVKVLPYNDHKNYITSEKILIGTGINTQTEKILCMNMNVNGDSLEDVTSLSYIDNNNKKCKIGTRLSCSPCADVTFTIYNRDLFGKPQSEEILYTDESGRDVYNKMCLHTLQDLHDHISNI